MPDGALGLAISTERDAAAAARRLVGARIDQLEPVAAGGRNSRVFHVRAAGAWFALKHYPGDRRGRLKTETDALALMVRHNIAAVPRVLASDPARGYALMSWIDGDRVVRPTAPDIDEAVHFLAQTHALRRVADAERQPLAAEACLSGSEISCQLDRRLERLADPARDDRELAGLLSRLSEMLSATLLPQAAAGYARLGLSFSKPIAQDARSLCPSDFGFHNALRGPRGVSFVDFEYFGWDDPAKLVCDVLLHPATRLAPPLRARFAAGVASIYGEDRHFAARVKLLYPLFAARWCLILLNEFLPERWATRVHAGASGDWRQAKERQLAQATLLFDIIRMEDWSLAA